MKPDVSVCLITYNHERFIAEAVDSVLRQQAPFALELVVGEDGSTDGTRRILERMAAGAPETIRLLPPEGNLGMHRNFARTLAACRGRYIALLEGDDFWTDERKLARQVEHLESNPECALCFHDVHYLDPDGTRRLRGPPPRDRMTADDLLERNAVPTVSAMFRAAQAASLPAWFEAMPVADWPLFVWLARRGFADRIPRAMAAYRLHAGGFWSTKGEEAVKRATLQALAQFRCHLGREHAAAIGRGMCACHAALAARALDRGEHGVAWRENWNAVRARPSYGRDFLAVAARIAGRAAVRLGRRPAAGASGEGVP